jgi:hypothetical protein
VRMRKCQKSPTRPVNEPCFLRQRPINVLASLRYAYVSKETCYKAKETYDKAKETCYKAKETYQYWHT